MADNTTLPAGSGGDTLRTLEDADLVKWPIGVCSYATSLGSPDVLQVVTPAAGLPVQQQTGHAFAVTGTFYQATQPVTNAGPFAVQVDACALPSGAATAANQSTIITALGTIDGHVDELETTLAALNAKVTAVNTGAVVIASSALPTGASTAANQATGNASLASLDGKTPALGQAVAAASTPVVLTAIQLSALTPVSTIAATMSGTWTVGLSAGTNAIGKLAANSGVDIGDVDVLTLPAITIAAAQTLATVTAVTSITNTVNTAETRPSTATLANVTGTGSSITIQASNSARRGWYVFNDSGVTVYLKFGSSASSTSFTVKLATGDYYELPHPCYSGIITGNWASGDIRVTELI